MSSVIKVQNLKKYFVSKDTIFSKTKYIKAVDGINFEIAEGEFFGLIGESGCGKTTTGRMLLGLIPPTGGDVWFDGEDISKFDKKSLKVLRRKAQMIFQDPYSSMNFLYRLSQIIKEPMVIHNLFSKSEREEKARTMMEAVDLSPPDNFLDKHPHELSGGQRQRASIARALVLSPRFIVADEAVANLDVSMRVGVLDLMMDLKDKFGFSTLYITHDISVARYVCERLGVMYLGKIVEQSASDTVVNHPFHPYTQALMGAIPRMEAGRAQTQTYSKLGEIPDALNLPSGCRFHPRCRFAKKVCSEREPELREVAAKHFAACHFAEQFL